MNVNQRLFMLLPLIHSEEISDHEMAYYLLNKYLREHEGYNEIKKFWQDHTKVIRQFHRYPNRNEIILYKSIKTPSIEGCGVGRLKEIAKRINNLDFFSEDYDDFSTSIFSEIITTNIDKEGRFLIPEELKLYAGIKTEAAFFGQGHYFQIWEPKKGLKNTEDSRRRLLKEKKSLRMMLTQQK